MVNTNKIKGRIIELGYQTADISKKMGMAQSTFSQKINNIRNFTLDEAWKMCKVLKIELSEFGDYFFA